MKSLGNSGRLGGNTSKIGKKVVLGITALFVMSLIGSVLENEETISKVKTVSSQVEEASIRTINLGVNGIRNPEVPTSLMDNWANDKGHYVYFGNYYKDNGVQKEPIKWRVLNIGNSSDFSDEIDIDNMLLLSDNILDNVYFNKDYQLSGGEYYKAEKNATKKHLYNDYEHSDIRTWLNGKFIDAAFDVTEKRALNIYRKEETIEENIKHSELKGDKAFILSAMEANASIYGFAVSEDISKYNVTRKLASTAYVNAVNANNKGIWQLRSVYNDRGDVTSIVSDGGIDYTGITTRYSGVAPAINIDTTKIIYTARQGFDKTDILATTRTVTTAQTWNMAMQKGEGFEAKLANNKNRVMVTAGDIIDINIAKVPNTRDVVYNQISAMIVDSNDVVVAYGQVSEEVKKGNIEVIIPYDIEDGEYTLKLFAEDVNTSETKNGIDYVSNMSDMALVITSGVGDIEDKLRLEHSLVHGVKAVLYDNDLYAEGGKGVALTENGVDVTEWDYQASKFLQIDVNLHSTAKDIHVVEVKLPKEMYFLGQFTTPPAGFKEVVFTKNSNIKVNGGAREYSVNAYSGTAKFYLDAEVTRATIQMELRYDRAMWDKTTNTSITADGVIPIKVSMRYEAEKGVDLIGGELKSVKANKVYSSYGKGRYLHINENTTKYDPVVRNAKVVHYNIVEDKQVGESYYFDEAVFEVKIPSAVDDNGTKHYLKYNATEVEINKGCFYNAVNYEIIEANESVLKIRVKNAYFRNGLVVSMTYECPKNFVSDMVTKTFTNGGFNIYAKSVNGKEVSFLTSSHSTSMAVKLDENVGVSTSNGKGAYMDTSRDGVTMAGGFYLSNTGSIASEPKKITIEYPDKLLITTHNVHGSTLDRNIDIKYTLKDENGVQVYLDNQGNRVNSFEPNAKGEWTVTISNNNYGYASIDNLYTLFTRNNLPDAHRKYFFKSMQYTVKTLKAQAKGYAYSADYSPYGAGNYHGYLASNVYNGERLKTYVTIEGEKKGLLGPYEIATVVSNYCNPSFGINTVNISKNEITAGEDVDVNGYIFTTAYPYGNAQRFNNIIMGILVPTGVTIDKDNIELRYGSNTGMQLDIERVKSKTADAGQTLWIVEAEPDAAIGYYNEGLGNMNTSYRLYFNISLTTSNKLNLQTLFTDKMLYVSGVNTYNSSGGAYAWASEVDKYDLNGNGSTTDRIGVMDYTLSKKCVVNPKPPSLDIEDYIQINGKGSVDGKDAHIGDVMDEITYNLNIKCIDEGVATEFEYYMPIPKVESGRDEYLVIGDKELAFDMKMLEEPNIVGDNLYYIEYAVNAGLTLNTARRLSENRWYSYEELRRNDKDWSDVTMLRIKAIDDNSIKRGDNTTIKVKLQADKSDNAVYKDLRNRWKSSGYYKFETENIKLSGYFSSSGCNADIAFEAAEVETISLVGTISKSTGRLVVDNTFPKQINDMKKYRQKQSYTLTELGTNNVTIVDKDYMLANQNTMSSADANEQLAFTIQLLNNNGEYHKELDKPSHPSGNYGNGSGKRGGRQGGNSWGNTNLVSWAPWAGYIDLAKGTGQYVGTNYERTLPKFVISMYYGRNFTDFNKERSITFTLQGDKGVTLRIVVKISFEEVNYINIENGEEYYHSGLNQEMKLFYTYDMLYEQNDIQSNQNHVVKNEPIKFTIVKARNSEKVDFALSTYKNYYYTSFYVDNKYIQIYDDRGYQVKPKQVVTIGDKNIQIKAVDLGGNGGADKIGNKPANDILAEWEEWREKNPWADVTSWNKWHLIQSYVQYTNVYSLEGNKEYTMYISDEYIDMLKDGADILYMHSVLPRVKTTMPLFIVRRTVYELY